MAVPSFARPVVGAVLAIAGLCLVVLSVAAGGQGQGEGHTPVTLCHWVPAHGGSYIVITVDDDGANGNANLQAHMGHENDIIPAPAGGCPAATATPARTETVVAQASPTRTPTPGGPTHTPTRTKTPGGPTDTPTRTNTPGGPTDTPTSTKTPGGPTDTPTRTSTPGLPTTTPSFTNTPTHTFTPVPPTSTATSTPGGPTNTPTRTSTPGGPTNTPTATSTTPPGGPPGGPPSRPPLIDLTPTPVRTAPAGSPTPVRTPTRIITVLVITPTLPAGVTPPGVTPPGLPPSGLGAADRNAIAGGISGAVMMALGLGIIAAGMRRQRPAFAGDVRVVRWTSAVDELREEANILGGSMNALPAAERERRSRALRARYRRLLEEFEQREGWRLSALNWRPRRKDNRDRDA